MWLVGIIGAEGSLAFFRQLAQPGEVIRSEIGQRQRHQLTLDEAAGTGEIVELFAGDDRHPHRAVGQRFQRLFGHQPAERLAHRHGARLQPFGEVLDAQ
jgi:hypothetical protein